MKFSRSFDLISAVKTSIHRKEVKAERRDLSIVNIERFCQHTGLVSSKKLSDLIGKNVQFFVRNAKSLWHFGRKREILIQFLTFKMSKFLLRDDEQAEIFTLDRRKRPVFCPKR